jgi:hypothetical protein
VPLTSVRTAANHETTGQLLNQAWSLCSFPLCPEQRLQEIMGERMLFRVRCLPTREAPQSAQLQTVDMFLASSPLSASPSYSICRASWHSASHNGHPRPCLPASIATFLSGDLHVPSPHLIAQFLMPQHSHGSNTQAWVQILVWPFPGCMTLDTHCPSPSPGLFF